MSEQDNSQLDGTNPVEETDEDVDIDFSTEEDDSKLQEELAKKDDIIRHLTARAKKAEQLKKSNYKPNEDFEDVKSVVKSLELAEQKRQFGYENSLSPDEADYIFKISPKPTKELLEDPFIKGGLEAIRSAKKTANNTPPLSSRSPRFETPKSETPDERQSKFDEWKNERFGNK